MSTKNELQKLVEKALATAYDKKVRELAMATINKSDMKKRLENLWYKLNEHLIKLVAWGDAPH